MSRQAILPLGIVLALAGCSTTQPLPDHPGAVAAIEDYYRGHAWEKGARCVLPEMDVTRAEILDSAPDRLVVQVRYFWSDQRRSTDNFANTCNGFETRTFTLVQGQVVEMTGEQRP
ncbi:hypothetical protein [Geminicoccus roseus]|uniref:hypothetical protein n=1 Tax=Geminicoccus roseus TaxID=404900 RepID=UPI000424F829|nr:hypothetical protein [Geminicoccus roseus]